MGVEEGGGVGGKKTLSSPSKRRKRKPKRSSPVQILYETCKEVFADCGSHIIPSPEKIEKLASLLDGMSQDDVGLQPEMPFFSSSRSPIITYMRVFECDKFSIGIFCLPPNSVIPLHNHPGMTVFSKLLFGTMHFKAYDWLKAEDPMPQAMNDPKGHPVGMKMAKLKVNTELTSPCKPSILYPTDGGNMHCFTARTACAMLDVLGPPYSDLEGRHCEYFSETPLVEFSAAKEEEKAEYAWLGQIEKPEELSIVRVPYNGPRISTKRKR